MFYKFCGVAGRVVAATNRQTPLFPISPVGLSRALSPQVTYAKSDKMATVASSNNKVGKNGEGFMCPKVKANQERFQKDDGLPVHLKGGPMDKVLLYTTVGLVGIGLSMSLHYMYTEAFKK